MQWQRLRTICKNGEGRGSHNDYELPNGPHIFREHSQEADLSVEKEAKGQVDDGWTLSMSCGPKSSVFVGWQL